MTQDQVSLLIKEPGTSKIRYVKVRNVPFTMGNQADADVPVYSTRKPVRVRVVCHDGVYKAHNLAYKRPEGSIPTATLVHGTKVTSGGVRFQFFTEAIDAELLGLKPVRRKPIHSRRIAAEAEQTFEYLQRMSAAVTPTDHLAEALPECKTDEKEDIVIVMPKELEQDLHVHETPLGCDPGKGGEEALRPSPAISDHEVERKNSVLTAAWWPQIKLPVRTFRCRAPRTLKLPPKSPRPAVKFPGQIVVLPQEAGSPTPVDPSPGEFTGRTAFLPKRSTPRSDPETMTEEWDQGAEVSTPAGKPAKSGRSDGQPVVVRKRAKQSASDTPPPDDANDDHFESINKHAKCLLDRLESLREKINQLPETFRSARPDASPATA